MLSPDKPLGPPPIQAQLACEYSRFVLASILNSIFSIDICSIFQFPSPQLLGSQHTLFQQLC